MKILGLIHPYIPSYFNAGHRLAVFQVGAHLRAVDSRHDVTCVDAAALNHGWRDLCSLLMRRFDLIALFNDFDGLDGFGRLMHHIRTLSPRSRTITFGRLSKQTPNLFKGYGLDAIHCSGDFEHGVAAYARSLQAPTAAVPGVMLKSSAYQVPAPGGFLPAESWAMPDVSEVPYEDYLRLSRHDLNKYCAIPNLVELVVPASRSCPVGCFFCDVPAIQGHRERRYPLGFTLFYISEAFASGRFAYVSFYSPIFTLDRPWVLALCEGMRERRIKWKCATTLHHLDRELISSMGRGGCVRISVGLETLDAGAASLPRIKRRSGSVFDEIASACSEGGIELNCFVMVGLPGSTFAGTTATIERVLAVGARVRPTIYTPYDRLSENSKEPDVGLYNRHLFVPGHAPAEEAQYYTLLYDNPADRPATVGAVIATGPASPRAAQHHALLATAEPSIGARLIERVQGLPAEEYREYRGFLNLANNELGHPDCTTLAKDFLANVDPELVRAYPYHIETERRCAAVYGIDPSSAMLTAGADDAIKMICSLLVPPAGRIILQTPNYDRYERYGRLFGAQVIPVPFVPDDPDFISRFSVALAAHGPSVAVLTNPDGFCGRCYPVTEVANLAAACAHRGHLLVIDEAYADFAGISHLSLLRDHQELVIVKSFSKSLGAAGLRIGVLFAAPQHIAALSRWRSVNAISGLASAYLDYCLVRQPDTQRIIADICTTRDWLEQAIRQRIPEWVVHPSRANFLLVDPGDARACAALVKQLAQEGIRIRQLGTIPGFLHHARITVWSRATMEEALSHLPVSSGTRLVKGYT